MIIIDERRRAVPVPAGSLRAGDGFEYDGAVYVLLPHSASIKVFRFRDLLTFDFCVTTLVTPVALTLTVTDRD